MLSRLCLLRPDLLTAVSSIQPRRIALTEPTTISAAFHSPHSNLFVYITYPTLYIIVYAYCESAQTRGDVATAPGAAPGASYKTAGSAATAGAVAAGGSGHGDEGARGYGDSQSDEQRKVGCG
jgi:hypothetical protein